MRIAFLSNFYNHHQSYVSKELFRLTEGNYRFIETSKIPEEQLKLGYSKYKDEYVINFENDKHTAIEWIDSADVVVFGSAPEYLLENRKKNNKIIFRYSERPLKNGFEIAKYPIRWLRWHRNSPKSKPIYMLCASGYTALDYSKFGMYKNKVFKWGYFPECKEYEELDILLNQKRTKEILWCGRFLDWKHPDDVIEVAKLLRNDGYQFHISIIGTGEMENELYKQIEGNSLENYVSILGSMSPQEVRKYMETAGIYLFTSDRKEGWGAVLNEAMNSGCAVVASDEIGSVPYLIKDNINGLIYKSKDVKFLYEKTKLLLDSPSEQRRMGKEAYSTIVNEWNYKIASQRLMQLFEQVLDKSNQINLYENGPCSKA